MPKQVRATATRAAILLAAAREFEDRGFDGARLDGIASRGDISKGSLYFHFGSKLEIGRALIDAAPMNWSIIVADVTGSGSRGMKAASEFTRRVAQVFVDDVQVRAAMVLTRTVPQLASTVDPYEQWTRLLTVFMEQAIADDELPPNCDSRHVARLAVMAFFGNYLTGLERDSLKQFPTEIDAMWTTVGLLAGSSPTVRAGL